MHIYFAGITGAGIGPLALICQDAGYTVTGSDIADGRFGQVLKQRGIPYFTKQDGGDIAAVHGQQPIDWLVVSSALPADHPEIQFAQAHGIRVSKRADVINFLLKDRHLDMVAVAGTHGKTTTTAMLVWLFTQFDVPVSYSVGSQISFGPSGAFQEGSKYFVYECDEYDRNMLEFRPSMSLVTMVDYDHPDTYPTREAYDEAFERFITQSKCVVLWQRDAEKLGVEHSCNICIDEQDAEVATIKLAGQHNRENAWQAATAFDELFPDFGIQQVLRKLDTFPGTERRFERLADGIYTDYAHHPTEVRATLQLASELSDNVVAVYQPHQNIRQHENLQEYGDCFNKARRVYWLPTYLTREDPKLKVLTPQELIDHLDKPDMAEPAELDDRLIGKLRDARKGEALIVFMGAGPIDDWVREHLKEL